MVTGIEERHQAEELERQADGIGEAAEGIVSGARQLEQTARAVNRLDGRLEQKAERRLSSETESTVGQRQSMQADGVAEVVLRKIAPDDLARYQAEVAQATAPAPPIEKKQASEQERKRRRRRQIYQQYAAKFEGRSVYECDLLVVRRLMRELLTERGGQRLRDYEISKVGSILLQGPVAQQLKQTQGKEAGLTYAMEVLTKVKKVVEREQDRGMEM